MLGNENALGLSQQFPNCNCHLSEYILAKASYITHTLPVIPWNSGELRSCHTVVRLLCPSHHQRMGWPDQGNSRMNSSLNTPAHVTNDNGTGVLWLVFKSNLGIQQNNHQVYTDVHCVIWSGTSMCMHDSLTDTIEVALPRTTHLLQRRVIRGKFNQHGLTSGRTGLLS